MDFFEDLRKGSPLHAVGIRSDSSFMILPINPNDDASMRVFQDVVLEAIAQADDDYEVKPRRFTQRSIHGCFGAVYDCAVISKVT